jgi:hypothetical protein
LAPRLNVLAETLCASFPEEDVEEQERRRKLDE